MNQTDMKPAAIEAALAERERVLAEKETLVATREALLDKLVAASPPAASNVGTLASLGLTHGPVKMRCLTKRWKGAVMLEPGDPVMWDGKGRYNPKTLEPWDTPPEKSALRINPAEPVQRPPGAGPVAKKGPVHPLP